MEIRGIDLSYQRHFTQHVELWVASVLAPMDKGQGEPTCLRRGFGRQVVGGFEKNDCRLAQALVDLAGELGVLAAWVALAVQFARNKDEALDVSLVERRITVEQLGLGANGNFLVSYLKEDVHRLGGLAECLLGFGVLVFYGKLRDEVVHASREFYGARASVAEGG